MQCAARLANHVNMRLGTESGDCGFIVDNAGVYDINGYISIKPN